MKNDNKILNTIKVIILAFALTAGVQYVLAQSWAPPTQSPPAGNTYAPLNVGSTGQIKDGGLTLGNTPGDLTYGLLVIKGLVGIGTPAPTVKLDVVGNVQATSFCLPGVGPTYGCISAWPTGGGGGGGVSGSGTTDFIPKWTSNSNPGALGNSSIIESIIGNETNVGIGTGLPGATAKLDVNGSIKIRGSGAPSSGKVLTAGDTSGNATWQFPAGITCSGSGACTLNKLPKFGSASNTVSNSQISDNGTNGVGISNILGIDISGRTLDYANAIWFTGIPGNDPPRTDRITFNADKPNFEFWNRTGSGTRANLMAKKITAKQITLSGGNEEGDGGIPASGKVLTATNASGDAEWRSPVITIPNGGNTNGRYTVNGREIVIPINENVNFTSKTATCDTGKVLISCTGGVIVQGTGSGDDNESEIIVPNDPGDPNNSCRLYYENENVNRPKLYAHVYALCM